MKYLISILIMYGLSLTCQAQFDQGQILASASSNLSFLSTDFGGDNNINTFNIGLSGGYFVIDNVVAGLNFSIDRTSLDELKNSTFAIGPFGRYYIENVFLGASFEYVNITNDLGLLGESEEDGSYLTLFGGYAAFITDRIAVEPSIGYSIGLGGLDDNSVFAFRVGFSFYLDQ